MGDEYLKGNYSMRIISPPVGQGSGLSLVETNQNERIVELYQLYGQMNFHDDVGHVRMVCSLRVNLEGITSPRDYERRIKDKIKEEFPEAIDEFSCGN